MLDASRHRSPRDLPKTVFTAAERLLGRATSPACRSFAARARTLVAGLALLAISSAAPGMGQPGSIDLSFNADDTPGKVAFGTVLNSEEVLDLAIDSQGRILVAYASYAAPIRGVLGPPDELLVRRHLPSGALDLSFATSGIYTAQGNWYFLQDDVALVVDAGDAVYLAFTSDEEAPPIGVRGPLPNRGFWVEKITSGGLFDRSTFVQFDLTLDGLDQFHAMALCGASLILVGDAHNAAGDADVAVAKMTAASLDLDPGFSGDGKVTFAIDLGTDKGDYVGAADCLGESIYLAGGAGATATTSQGFVAQLDGDGNLVASFDGDGIKLFSAPDLDWDGGSRGVQAPAAETWFHDLLVDLNGLLWVVGEASTPNGDRDAVLVVADGSGNEVTTIGIDGWRGFATTTGATDHDDDFHHVLETSPTQRTLIGQSTGPSPIAVRLLDPSGSNDPSFASGDLTSYPTLGFEEIYDATQDAIGRLLIGGTLSGAGHTDGLFARLRNDEIFLDGFESGNTNAW